VNSIKLVDTDHHGEQHHCDGFVAACSANLQQKTFSAPCGNGMGWAQLGCCQSRQTPEHPLAAACPRPQRYLCGPMRLIFIVEYGQHRTACL
jgi:hypothetical protein